MLNKSCYIFPRRLKRITSKSYNLLNPAEYFENKHQSLKKKTYKKLILNPLPGANHSAGTTDEINLVGVPHGEDIRIDAKKNNIYSLNMVDSHADLSFLQIPPEEYLARQRFLSHKSAMNEVEDYDVKSIQQLDPTVPITWEECVVNLNVLDMLDQNKLYDELNLTKGLAVFSYPHLKSKSGEVAEMPDLLRSINKHLMGHPDTHSEYREINEALYLALSGNQKVMLGEMPETLFRRKLADEFTLEELQDIFKFLLEQLSSTREDISLRESAFNYLPHIFQAPKDLYYTALLKEAFQGCASILAMVGSCHLYAIDNLWQPPPQGINFRRATELKQRNHTHTDEYLIEKQALLDALLEIRPWGKSYITNPFPYIVDDISLVKENDLDKMVKCFSFHYSKYMKFKETFLKNHNLELFDYKYRKIALLRQVNKKKKKSAAQQLISTNLELLNEYNLPEKAHDLGKNAFHPQN
jgi:hypothetical protein